MKGELLSRLKDLAEKRNSEKYCREHASFTPKDVELGCEPIERGSAKDC